MEALGNVIMVYLCLPANFPVFPGKVMGHVGLSILQMKAFTGQHATEILIKFHGHRSRRKSLGVQLSSNMSPMKRGSKTIEIVGHAAIRSQGHGTWPKAFK